MDKWEAQFDNDLNSVDLSKRHLAGVLLSIVPDKEKWNLFLSAVKDYWNFWRDDLNKFPKCLIVLYDGLAFYEYSDNTFWPQFSRVIGANISSNLQSGINDAFLKAAENLGLNIQRRDNGISYVGSAIYHIGIPLSLWDDFIEICEWALWQHGWNSLTDKEWADSDRETPRWSPEAQEILVGESRYCFHIYSRNDKCEAKIDRRSESNAYRCSRNN